jgi:hypothetical protein
VTLRTLAASAGKAKATIMTLATGSFPVAGGRVATIVLHLSTKARTLLARSHLLHARATIAARDLNGAEHTDQVIVTIRAQGAKQSRR